MNLIEEICTAAKDLAQMLAGGGKNILPDDIVERVAACDKAGIALSSHARSECVRAKGDICARFNRYDEFTDMFMSDSQDMQSLKDAGVSDDDCTNFAMEMVETFAMNLLQSIPKDAASKQAAKFKDDALKMLDVVALACEKEGFLAKGILEQDKAGSR